ncbi:hypothetical protein [Micromonospora zamorensis]|uniref:hypothetical protein n=1 Tax=Micromonospora zamorensis TaxID=709883 RepID=UPI00081F82B2|nr:hypothetical protein [Micromonospora zamorensis]SCG36643.1 O-antigen ligase like membrane protein [Micromonospora zamorensis]
MMSWIVGPAVAPPRGLPLIGVRLSRRLAVAGTVILLLAVVACLLTGLSPLLPIFLALLALLAVSPVVGLGYALVVLNTPLGLWFLGAEGVVGDAFGGRDYALGLSAAVVVCVLFTLTVVLHRWTRRQLIGASAALLAVGVWSLIGFAHHGVAQTLVGVRLTVLPVLLLVVLCSLTRRQVLPLMTVLAWVLIANAVASVGELAVGPARLVQWGFEEDTAVRYIGDTFRVPGLTSFNAELGMLAGAYLLGYVALWLTPMARPKRLSWHAGAAASVLCLVLSTSRSGAFLVAGGLVAAVVLNRSGGAAGRRRARIVGLGVVAAVVAGFVALGMAGASSLFQRFDVWAKLLATDLPLWGLGIGGVGAATTSRVTSSQQIFIDNYFVSVALQFGPVLGVALVAVTGYLLWKLWRRTAERPGSVLLVALLAGLACSFLVIEAWEYPGGMMCLGIFAAYGRHLDAAGLPPDGATDATAEPTAEPAVPPTIPTTIDRPTAR